VLNAVLKKFRLTSWGMKWTELLNVMLSRSLHDMSAKPYQQRPDSTGSSPAWRIWRVRDMTIKTR
jgi:hypothetical protein